MASTPKFHDGKWRIQNVRPRPGATILTTFLLLRPVAGLPADGYSNVAPAQPPAPVVVTALQAERDRLATAIVSNDTANVVQWVRSRRTLDFNFDDEIPGHRSSQSPLTLAAAADKPEVARLMIKARADVRRSDGFGQAPIHLARSPAMLELLIKAGADPNAQDRAGSTAAVRALEAGNVAMLDLLRKNGVSLAAPEKGPDLFTRVVELRKPELIAALIERGVDPRRPPTQALWPLIEQGDAENATRLIRAGADPNAHTDRDWLLERALFRKQWTIAQALLDAGANPRLPDSSGCARKGAWCQSTQVIRDATFHAPMLARLKTGGLDLDTVAADGNTALTALILERPMAIRAVRSGNTTATIAVNPTTGDQVVRQQSAGAAVPDIPAPDNAARVRVLLAAGADPNKRTRDLTPLMVATLQHDDRGQIIEALLQTGAHIEFDAPIAPSAPDATPSNAMGDRRSPLTGMRVGPLGWALLHGKPGVALQLVQRDRKIEPADANLTYFAAVTGAWDLLVAIAPLARDVDAADRARVTALMLAADAGRADAVHALIAAGANVNARSARHWPPLWERDLLVEFAAGLSGHSSSGAKLVGGYTALGAARAQGHAEVARILVAAGGKE